MFSSLPSASKVYAAGASKSKQKCVSTNARKKRRKSKIASVNHVDFERISDTTTLIGASKSSNDPERTDYESDAVESLTGSVVRFCVEDSAGNINRDTLQNIADDNYDDSEFSSVAKPNGTPKRNVVITSAEIHYDTAAEAKHTSSEASNSSLSSDEESVINNNFRTPPVIVISSSDTPRNSIDENADVSLNTGEAISEKGLDPTEKEPLKNDNDLDENSNVCTRFASINIDESPPQAENTDVNSNNEPSGETIDTVHSEIEVPSANENTNTVSMQGAVSMCNEEVITENPSKDPDDDDDDDDDEASVHSDCCYSKNIFNEYSTESVDETDDIFMVDSKQSSNGDSSFSRSESDEVDNVVICSQESSEVSATESSLGDIKNTVTNEAVEPKLKHQAINVPDSKFTVDVACQKSLDLSNDAMFENLVKAKTSTKSNEKGKHILKRTSSLPCVLECKRSLNDNRNAECYLFAESRTSDKFSSEACFSKSRKRTKRFHDDVRSEVSHRTGGKGGSEPYLRSYRSSVTELSESSSSMSNVLPLVPVREARLRSFVVGSIRAAGSLLGVEELCRYFPDKKVKVFVGTWNMNEQSPPKSIDDFLLPLGVSYVPDIYAVGVQEGGQPRSEWEVLMQTTLGPSHVLLMSTSFGLLHLAVFIRRDLIWFCSEPEDAHVATRPGSMVKTKGAVAISFMFFGTSFLFINSHLTAHERKLKERLSDYEKICSTISLPNNFPLKLNYQSKDVTSRFDNVFWCGDLNFRLDHDRPSVVEFVERKLKKTIDTCEFLLKHDQLHRAMNDGIAFHGFEEGIINFAPSYKFNIGTSCFSSAKQRVPSYTDRVLFRCKKKGSITCTHYNGVPSIKTSDHKPVYGVFEVDVRAGRDNIPLAAGMFRREVYLEANRRRAAALEVAPSQKNSTICNIM